MIILKRSALNSEVQASIKKFTCQGDFPEYLALVNPVNHNAFTMRLDRSMKFLATKLIVTSKHAGRRLDRPLVVVHHTIQANVCDAIYLKSFHIRLGDGVPEAYAKRLWGARFSLSIDVEPMVASQPLRKLLGQKEVLLPRRTIKDRTCLFHANRLKDDENVDEDGWIGYMLPNCTQIQAELDQVPEGGGLIRLEIGWSFGIYTTKERPASKPND